MARMIVNLTLAKAYLAVAAMAPTSIVLGHGATSALRAPTPVHHGARAQSTALAPRSTRIRSGRASARVTLTSV